MYIFRYNFPQWPDPHTLEYLCNNVIILLKINNKKCTMNIVLIQGYITALTQKVLFLLVNSPAH